MASQPKAPIKSHAKDEDEDETSKPEIHDPPPAVKTIADEQRERSAEIERQGVEEWKAERDERTEEDKQGRQVPGVRSPQVEGGSWKDSTRSTPEARKAQNPAASR